MKSQILFLTVGAAMASVLLSGGIASLQALKSQDVAEKVMEGQVLHSLKETADGSSRAVTSQAGLLGLKVSGQLNHLESEIRAGGGLSLGSTQVPWSAVNQINHEKSAVTLPQMILGSAAIPRSTSFNDRIAIVDETSGQLGGACTIFQRMNEKGDMLRIATSVRAKDGSRGSGTFIPAQNPDGTQNGVVKAVLAKKAFKGVAYVVDSWCQTEYRPILGPSGSVIGMTYAGEKLSAVPAVRDFISHMKIGEHGSAFAVVGSGLKAGTYVVPPEGQEEGAASSGFKDAKGGEWIEPLIRQAREAKGSIVAKPALPDLGATYVAAVYVPQWDWVVFHLHPAKDVEGPTLALKAAWTTLQMLLLGGGILAALATGVCAFFAAGAFARPLKRLAVEARRTAEGRPAHIEASGMTNEIGELEAALHAVAETQKTMTEAFVLASQGDLTVRCEERSDEDEMGRALNRMVSSLRGSVSDVRSQADQTQAISHRLEEDAKESLESQESFSLSLQEVSQATAETAKTASVLADSSNDLSGLLAGSAQSVDALRASITEARTSAREQGEAALRAAEVAQKGGASVGDTLAFLDEIRTRTRSAAEALRELDRRQIQVGDFASSIEEIASQTNLLALNAAIEAARAGQHGQGFAVVADEVRRLAVRSSEATKEILAVLSDIQSGARDAVKAMEESQATVERGAERGGLARQALTQILDSITQMRSLAQSVADQVEGMSASAESLQSSIDGMVSIGEGTLAAAEELTAGSEELSATMSHMTGEMDRQKQMVQEVRNLAGELLAASQVLTESFAAFNTEGGKPHLHIAA